STGGAIYGEVAEGAAATEDWPVRPASPYAASKAAFEHYLEVYRKTYGLPYTTLRYANVYGPRQDPNGEAGVVAIFINRLLAGEGVTLFARRTPGDEGCVRDYIWVGDVVEANILAMERELDGVYNVGTGIGRTTRDVLTAIEEAVGSRARVEPAPPRRSGALRHRTGPAGGVRVAAPGSLRGRHCRHSGLVSGTGEGGADTPMKAIVVTEPGGPEKLVWTDVDDPQPGPGELLVR